MKTSSILFMILVPMMSFFVTSCDDELENQEQENPSRNLPYAFIEGFEDSVAYTLADGLSPTDWMAGLPDERYVSNVTIPGTHDTMTGMGFHNKYLQYIFNMTAISQVATLDEQLESGIRFFDIRTAVGIDTLTREKELYCAHGISEINVPFASVIESMMMPFLEKHKSEFIVIKMQHDNGFENQMPWLALTEEVFGYFCTLYPDLFYKWTRDMNPTVGDVRGKIVLLCRNEYVVQSMPCAYVSWGDESADELESAWERKHDGKKNPGYIDYDAELNKCYMTLDPNYLRIIGSAQKILDDDPNSLVGKELLEQGLSGCNRIHVQDYYKTDTITRMTTKQNAVIKMLDTAKAADGVWTINHCSAYTSVSPRGYCENAEKINKDVVDYLLKNPSGHYGIVVMDFAGYDNVSCVINGGTPYTSDYLFGKKPMSQSLTNLLIMSNFK